MLTLVQYTKHRIHYFVLSVLYSQIELIDLSHMCPSITTIINPFTTLDIRHYAYKQHKHKLKKKSQETKNIKKIKNIKRQ